MMTNYEADARIDTAATYFVALFAGDPTQTGAGGSEITDEISDRQPITLGAKTTVVEGEDPDFVTYRRAANSAAVTFGASEAATDEATHFGFFDALTGGNLRYRFSLNTARPVTLGDTLTFPIGSLEVKFRVA